MDGVVFQFLDQESAVALSQTARRYRVSFSGEDLQKRLLGIYFPLYRPVSNIPYLEQHQRLRAAHSSKPGALCTKTFVGHNGLVYSTNPSATAAGFKEIIKIAMIPFNK